jgi:hypothetical protein
VVLAAPGTTSQPVASEPSGYAEEDRYMEEARILLAIMRDHPAQRAFDAAFLTSWRFADWRERPGSADGGVAVVSMADVEVEATALGPFGIPYARYIIGCGGACARRV